MSVIEATQPVAIMGALDSLSAARGEGILSISQYGTTASFGICGHLSRSILQELAAA